MCELPAAETLCLTWVWEFPIEEGAVRLRELVEHATLLSQNGYML